MNVINIHAFYCHSEDKSFIVLYCIKCIHLFLYFKENKKYLYLTKLKDDF